MKKIIASTILALMIVQLSAQKISNFDKDGSNKKSLSEFVELKIEKKQIDKVPLAGSAIAGIVLGPVFDIVSGVVKTQIEKRQKSYVATYSNSNEFPGTALQGAGKKLLIVRRFAIDSLSQIDNGSKLMAEYSLLITEEDGGVMIQLENVTLNGSKARFKPKDNLAISINLKAKANTASKAKDGTTENKDIEGEGKVIIPIIKVTGKQQVFGSDNPFGKVKIKGLKYADLNNIVFEVTVSETNINHVDPTVVQQILTNNTKEIQTILKAVFGVEDKK